MLPVARLIFPDEYVAEKHQREQEGDWDWDGFQEWPELVRLAEATGQLPNEPTSGPRWQRSTVSIEKWT